MEIIDELSTKIAGEIALSSSPSKAMRRWRELFNLTQSEVARSLGTSSSVVCDYESGRRKSPGTTVVKKFVGAIIRADAERGHPFLKSYEKSHASSSSSRNVVIDMREFESPITVITLADLLEGTLPTGKDQCERYVYGYTVIDSIKAILELSSEDYPRLYGPTTQRALIFTKVSYGRSPLIAVRVSNMKPQVVVMHGVGDMDKLGEKIAKAEGIPVILTGLELDEMLLKLRGISA